jgi:hypothetical protein
MITHISVRPARLARLAMSLLAGISFSVLTSSMALAANYTASNSSELIAAIHQANTDGAAHSTITLTAPIAMTGSTWPAVTKNLTITATDSTVLSSAGPTPINVSSGVDRTIAGPVRTSQARLESTTPIRN